MILGTRKEILDLDEIESICSSYFCKINKKIVVIVLARFDLDETKSILRKHFNYWNELTGKDVNFYWLGYGPYKNPTRCECRCKEDFCDKLKFSNAIYVSEVKRLEKLLDYQFDDEIGLLLLDCNKGSIQYEKSLYLNIENLAHQEVDTKLKKFIRCLIEVCSNNKCIEEVKTELKTKKTLYDLGDITVSDVLGAAGSGLGLIGSFLVS